jgi:CheY-like chemotaxis protein
MHSTPTYRTILVVDDHDAHRRLLEMVLGAHNYRVLSARDGHEALSLPAIGTPDAIILDVHMPTCRASTSPAESAACARLRRVPILFMTSAADADTRRTRRGRRRVRVIHKPIAGVDLDRQAACGSGR